MLEMRGEHAVERARRPAVSVGLDVLNDAIPPAALDARLQLRADLTEHRLDRQNHSLPQLQTAAATAVVVDLRLLVHPAADPVTDEVADHVEAFRLRVLLHRRADVADVPSGTHLLDREIEALLGGLHQSRRTRSEVADADRDGAVADEAVENRPEIESEDVAFAQLGAARDAVNDH